MPNQQAQQDTRGVAVRTVVPCRALLSSSPTPEVTVCMNVRAASVCGTISALSASERPFQS